MNWSSWMARLTGFLFLLVTSGIVLADPMGALSAAVHADSAKTAGAKGSGVTVGVISVGALGYESLEGTGLPKSVTIVGGDPGNGSGSSEGVEMMEAVHELAPNAKLVFCPYWDIAIQDCLYDLVTTYHVDVVVDDIGETTGYLSEGNTFSEYWDYIESQYPAVAVIHSSGNGQGNYYEGAYTPITKTIAGSSRQAQDFGASVGKSSDAFQTVSLMPGQSAAFRISDNDDPNTPSGSSNSWDTNNQVTAWILDSSGNVLATGNTVLGTDPSNSKEEDAVTLNVSYTNSSSKSKTVRLALAVTSTRSGVSEYFKIWAGSNQGNYAPFGVALSYATSGSAGSHLGASPGTLSVAAWQLGLNSMEPFSQTGPFNTNYSFTLTGFATAADFTPGIPEGTYTLLGSTESIQEPALSAPDAYPVYNLVGTFNYANPFGGTSAAAPVVAGAIAQLMSLGMTRDDAVAALEQTADHIVSGTSKGHWDGKDGYGSVDVYAAMQTFVTLPAATISTPSSNPSIQPGQTVTFAGSCSIGGGHTIAGYSWNFGDGATSTEQKPGAHTYAKAGTYTATFNCESDQGYSDGTPPTVTVKVVAPQPKPKPKTTASSGGGGSFGLLVLIGLAVGFMCRKRGR